VLDVFVYSHNDAFMRTTIDLPDELFRRVKARAALDGLKLKDLITRYVEQGLKQGAGRGSSDQAHPRKRSPLPVIEKAAAGIPIPALGRDELTRIELDEDRAKHDRSAGR
jgi:hypothetical protein